jgi:transposase
MKLKSLHDQILLLHKYVMHIEFLNTEIKNIESKIRINQLKYSCILPQSGIAFLSISEMMIYLEFGDITDFSKTEKLGSWSGICTSIHQSG